MAEGFQHQGEGLQMVKAETRNVENDPGIPVKSSLNPPEFPGPGISKRWGACRTRNRKKSAMVTLLSKITEVCVKPCNGQISQQQSHT
jgi:hypothetical protein